MRTALVINARQKQDHVARAVHGALSQTLPCSIFLSDQMSTDDTLLQMQRAVEAFGPHPHELTVLECRVGGPFCMASANAHFSWLVDQVPADTEYIFQCSGDDYSMPDRLKVCMEEIDRLSIKPACVACTMYFEKPGETNRQAVSGYPKESGFVSAADGLNHLAYGSTIHGWNAEFLRKVKDMPENSTPDVVLGFLASLDAGFYVVCNSQHVHVTHADLNNLGFQGRMLAATGEDALRHNEGNHYQLCAMLCRCFDAAYQLHPDGIPQDAYQALLNHILGQSRAWLEARKKLHQMKIQPMKIEEL